MLSLMTCLFPDNGWLRQNPLPADKGSYGNFNALANQNKRIIRDILESSEKPDNLYDERILEKLRGMYGSCMDESHLNEIGHRPLQNIIAKVGDLFEGHSSPDFGTTAADKRKNGLTAALGYLHSRGVPALFSFEVEGDAGVDPNDMTLWFSQPELGLPSKEYYEEESIVELYTDVIEHLLLALSDDVDKVAPLEVSSEQSVLGPHGDPDDPDGGPWWPPNPWPYPEDPEPGEPDDDDKGPISAKKWAHDIVEFEKRIARASLDLDILYQDPLFTYNPTTIEKLKVGLPQVNLDNYFAAFTPRNFPERVIVTYPAFVDSLSLILDETPGRTIKGYFIARAALSLSSLLGLDTEAWKAQRTLVETLQGIKKGAVGDRGEYCLGVVEQTLGFAAGRYFSNITFGGDSRKKGVKVITGQST
jgi:endothelin-converting enzyme